MSEINPGDSADAGDEVAEHRDTSSPDDHLTSDNDRETAPEPAPDPPAADPAEITEPPEDEPDPDAEPKDPPAAKDKEAADAGTANGADHAEAAADPEPDEAANEPGTDPGAEPAPDTTKEHTAKQAGRAAVEHSTGDTDSAEDEDEAGEDHEETGAEADEVAGGGEAGAADDAEPAADTERREGEAEAADAEVGDDEDEVAGEEPSSDSGDDEGREAEERAAREQDTAARRAEGRELLIRAGRFAYGPEGKKMTAYEESFLRDAVDVVGVELPEDVWTPETEVGRTASREVAVEGLDVLVEGTVLNEPIQSVVQRVEERGRPVPIGRFALNIEVPGGNVPGLPVDTPRPGVGVTAWILRDGTTDINVYGDSLDPASAAKVQGFLAELGLEEIALPVTPGDAFDDVIPNPSASTLRRINDFAQNALRRQEDE